MCRNEKIWCVEVNGEYYYGDSHEEIRDLLEIKLNRKVSIGKVHAIFENKEDVTFRIK